MSESNSNSMSINMNSRKKGLVRVPKNEYDRVLAVLSNKIDNIDGNVDSNGNGKHPNLASQMNKEDLKMIESSIKSRFQEMIIPDENFERNNGQYDTPMKKLIKQGIALHEKKDRGDRDVNNDDHDNDDNDSMMDDILNISSDSEAEADQSMLSQHSSDAEGDEEDEILDDEDLIDKEVHQKVKQIRKDVRNASMRLCRTRESVMNEKLNIIRNQMKILEGINESMNNLDNYDVVENNDNDNGNTGAGTITLLNSDLTAMEQLLTTLKTQLDTLGVELPENIQSLRDTIESVSTSIEKKAEGKFTGTERAIRARDDDSLWKKRLHPDEGRIALGGEDGRQQKTASSRLASFLSFSSR